MSRTPSDANAGMQVTRSPNNIYTALLIVALLALVGAAVFLGMTNNARYEFVLPMGEQYEDSQSAVSSAARTADDAARVASETMTTWPLDTRRTVGGSATETPDDQGGEAF